MSRTYRTPTLVALGLLTLTTSAMAGWPRRVVVVNPAPVFTPPVQTVYLAPSQSAVTPVETVYTTTTSEVIGGSVVAQTPIGPTAYVVPAAYSVVSAGRPVVTTTATVVPTTAIVTGPALTPVGYEVVGRRRTKVVLPRQVYRYGY